MIDQSFNHFYRLIRGIRIVRIKHRIAYILRDRGLYDGSLPIAVTAFAVFLLELPERFDRFFIALRILYRKRRDLPGCIQVECARDLKIVVRSRITQNDPVVLMLPLIVPIRGLQLHRFPLIGKVCAGLIEQIQILCVFQLNKGRFFTVRRQSRMIRIGHRLIITLGKCLPISIHTAVFIDREEFFQKIHFRCFFQRFAMVAAG